MFPRQKLAEGTEYATPPLDAMRMYGETVWEDLATAVIGYEAK